MGIPWVLNYVAIDLQLQRATLDYFFFETTGGELPHQDFIKTKPGSN